MTEDEKERRVVRARPPRPAAEPQSSDPSQGRSELPPPPATLAAGSEQFGRGRLPEGVASALQALGRLKPRDEVASIAFGESTVTIEHRYGLVVLVLPDGTRLTGTPAQASELAHLLTGSHAASTPKR